MFKPPNKDTECKVSVLLHVSDNNMALHLFEDCCRKELSRVRRDRFVCETGRLVLTPRYVLFSPVIRALEKNEFKIFEELSATLDVRMIRCRKAFVMRSNASMPFYCVLCSAACVAQK